jgi:hypothetical protein
VSANRFAQAQLITVLNGDSKALRTTGGQVVLNLVPLVNEALRNVQARASALLGKDITLPAISGSTIPAASCQKIAAAIRRPLPPTCGQIPLFKASALTAAQHAYQAFNRLVLALLIITPAAETMPSQTARGRYTAGTIGTRQPNPPGASDPAGEGLRRPWVSYHADHLLGAPRTAILTTEVGAPNDARVHPDQRRLRSVKQSTPSP